MAAISSSILSHATSQPDLYIKTPSGIRIHSSSYKHFASPVLENIVKSNKILKIQGVPNDAVIAFIGFIYSSRCSEEEMENYGMHLLVLSHVYSVTCLKRTCIKELAKRVTTDNVVDVLHLAKLCDAPDLYLNCLKYIMNHFEVVKKKGCWKFLQSHDPGLELDILRFMYAHQSRKKKHRKQREELKLYVQLSEAMECLEHICTEGCTHVRPYDVDDEVKQKKKKKPCSKFASTCLGLQGLILHFATCKKRVNGGCLRCKRMWQLFRLHSFICRHSHSCKVPFCRQIQLKIEQENKEDDERWEQLVRKVASAKAMSSLVTTKEKASRLEGP